MLLLLLLLLLLQNVGVELPNEEDGCTVTLYVTDRQTDIHYITTTTTTNTDAATTTTATSECWGRAS